MDENTVATYDMHAQRYAAKWLGKPMPAETRAAVAVAFQPGLSTLDIGSGSGRDVDWLVANGYPTVGIEASATMLAVARGAFPEHMFLLDSLPALASTTRKAHQVLCRNVLMHLPPHAQPDAVSRLLALLEPAGALVLTWRMDTDAGSARDQDGRLYAHVDPQAVQGALDRAGAAVHSRTVAKSGSSGKEIAVWVIRAGR
ncbi:MAG: class I SAM-dependent methyltransferase [Deltaproteobacteria bacterium]|nr:class I SAM-dependent methyltransferase [Deltaproteobacteria bacterium]